MIWYGIFITKKVCFSILNNWKNHLQKAKKIIMSGLCSIQYKHQINTGSCTTQCLRWFCPAEILLEVFVNISYKMSGVSSDMSWYWLSQMLNHWSSHFYLPFVFPYWMMDLTHTKKLIMLQELGHEKGYILLCHLQRHTPQRSLEVPRWYPLTSQIPTGCQPP